VDRHQVVILVVGAVMVGSFVLLVLWPRQRELSALGEAVAQERSEVNQKVMASREGVYVSARMPSLRQAQGLLARRLPTEPHVGEFLQMVADCVAAEPRVRHDVQKCEAIVVAGPAPSVPVRLRLVGPVDAVYRCLAGIEGLERLNRFRRVHFTASEDGAEVSAEAEILVYYLPGEESGEKKVQSSKFKVQSERPTALASVEP
jgi:Tfp pilus assembly protein PilO